MAMTCPSCGGELVELERSGVRIDACRNCRGIWLDRGELDRVVERERQVLGGVDEDEADFVREMTGHSKKPGTSEPPAAARQRTPPSLGGARRRQLGHRAVENSA